MSMRVRAPLAEGDVRRGRGEVMEDPYMSRLVKLVPAEAIGPFPFLMDTAERLQPTAAGARVGVYFVAWILLLVVIVVRWRATSEGGKGAQWGAVLIAAVAFFIWVHVMRGDFGFELLLGGAPIIGADGVTRAPDTLGTLASGLDDTKKFIANVMLVAWTSLAPVVYRGDESR
jgi:hypothetical protein